MHAYRSHVLVCAGAGCVSSGSLAVAEALEQALVDQGLAEEVKVVRTGCMGSCDLGPVAVIYPEGVFYKKLTPEDATLIVSEHLLKGRPVERLMYVAAEGEEPVLSIENIPFFALQQKIVLRNCGEIDPGDIEEYIARDGYEALAKALTEMTPEEVIATVKASGLRGRGGAGFPTGMKWEFTAKAEGTPKYVVCNADEGDPGAFMDRSVLEGDPHSLIEAMTIAGYAVGSSQGYVYVRAEYPLAIQRLQVALAQAREYGLLGEDILGSGHSFDIQLRMGAGAFVCGEETALMASIEGRRGEPRPRPPFPAQQGLFGKPTLLNNVETYANIAPIILNGPEWFSSFGTERSKGTKVFALAGHVNNTGLVEVPMGTPLGTIIYEIGGGIRGGRKFKAAQTGGPSGGCIPKEYLNTPVDYEQLKALGAIVGSGGLIVMDETTCMVDLARYFLDFVQDESCGKCPPCRIGTKRMLEILERLCCGEGREGDIELLEDLGAQIAATSLCGLGQTAPNPVLSMIKYFREEFEEHIHDKHCRAGTCSEMMKAPCEHACPAGIDVPAYVNLIAQGKFDEAYAVIRDANPFPSVCGRVCTAYCEAQCRRGQMDAPVAIRLLKRAASDLRTTTWKPELEPQRHRKVAVVGSGPAGLTVAYDLVRKGYEVTVFEKQAIPGGMLALGIPDYRLPAEILQKEIQEILDLGIELQTGVEFGKDITLQDLGDQGYEAVFLGIGCQVGIPLEVPGAEAEGVLDAVKFLRELALREEPQIGGRVAVIGGGDTAIDSARSALRLGAKEVHLVYRRTEEEMPAHPEEIEAARAEGIKFHMLAAPREVLSKQGKVAGLVCQQMRLGEFDKSGRRRPVPVEDADFTLEVDTVIAAIGQRMDPACVCVDCDGGKILSEPRTGETSLPEVFAGGDATWGPMTAVDAIADGHRAAAAIHSKLSGEPLPEPKKRPRTRVSAEVMAELEATADQEIAPVEPERIPEEQRCTGFCEVELGFCLPAACQEASRCLHCDYVMIEEE
ncbi:MAG: NADH-quinone oxidoreductase subunit NuoF [candidate division WS1 bacterium]|nr:NADH-quinone oxidoreductase subunit NuoF [candidate division WS1 bacterium]